jgi:uncharacterized protein with PIN domain
LQIELLALGICRKRHASVEETEQNVGEFLELTAPITDKEAHTALAAFSRYGKGTGTSRAAQPRRLLRVCKGEECSGDVAV